VSGLEVRVVVAVAAAGRESQAPDQGRRGVRQHVAVEVRQHDDVEVVGRGDQSVREVVHDEALEPDLRVFPGHPFDPLAKQAVTAGQHVVLRAAGDAPRSPLRLAPARQLEREARDAIGTLFRDHLERKPARAHLRQRAAGGEALEPERRQGVEVPLDPHVEILEILPHDHEVDALGARQRAAVAGPVARGPDVRVGLPAPAQVEQRERALATRRAEERRVGRVDRRACRERERGLAGVERTLPDRGVNELEIDAEPLEQTHRRPHGLGCSVLPFDHDHASGRHALESSRDAGNRRRSISSRPPCSRIESMSSV
jgi:hypothetical protein